MEALHAVLTEIVHLFVDDGLLALALVAGCGAVLILSGLLPASARGFSLAAPPSCSATWSGPHGASTPQGRCASAATDPVKDGSRDTDLAGASAKDKVRADVRAPDRSQTLLLPGSLDEYGGRDNPVRFIDAFVDGLDQRRRISSAWRRREPGAIRLFLCHNAHCGSVIRHQ
jgi:hypothetical protein